MALRKRDGHMDTSGWQGKRPAEEEGESKGGGRQWEGGGGRWESEAIGSAAKALHVVIAHRDEDPGCRLLPLHLPPCWLLIGRLRPRAYMHIRRGRRSADSVLSLYACGTGWLRPLHQPRTNHGVPESWGRLHPLYILKLGERDEKMDIGCL